MRTTIVGLIIGTGCILASGCATPLNSVQKQELETWKAKGLAIEEKDPGTAAVLGILPGGGSFYTGNIGIGIANLLMWPVSAAWDPVSGYDGAQVVNYNTTRSSLSKKMANDIRDLDFELESGKLGHDQYLLKKREIERKYSPDM